MSTVRLARPPMSRPPVFVSVHDVAPATEIESAGLISMVEAHGLRAALLVVPGPWRGAEVRPGSEFTDWLNALAGRGHEVVLHGWDHVADRRGLGWLDPRRLPGHLLTRGCAEFHGIAPAEAQRRLADGLDRLRAAGVPPRGFVAPGWLMDESLHELVRWLGLEHVTSRTHLFDLVNGRRWYVPTATNRPDSPLQGVGRRWFEQFVTGRLQTGRAVGIALHPADLAQPDLRHSIDRMLGLAAQRGRCVTPAEVITSPQIDTPPTDTQPTEHGDPICAA